MDAAAFHNWKQRISKYQQSVRHSQPIQQTALFDLPPTHCNPEGIDPFNLRLESMSFYRMPVVDESGFAIYFVLDAAAELILYIGETSRSYKRWKSTHDCKDYIASYLDLHYQYQMPSAVGIAYFWDALANRKHRQKLEQTLIQRWRTPFNREMWSLWGQPFTI